MRLAALLLLAILAAGCLDARPALPPSSAVHREAFTKDGGPWRAYHLEWCGLCGPDSPSRLFVVFADGKMVEARFVARSGQPFRAEPGVAYDVAELASVLPASGGNVSAVTTAAVNDTRIVRDLEGRWHPEQAPGVHCADFAAQYGWWPEGGAPARVDLECPPTDGTPMQPFAAALERLRSNVEALGEA